MTHEKKQKLIKSSIGVLISILLFFTSGLTLPVIDATTDDYFHESITKVGVAYATVRVLNASVSIVKESSLQLEPAGVGVSLAVGQALDPIDDMTERLSGVLVTAITSLGVQKLAYEISVSLAPPVLSVCLLALSVLIWFDNGKLASLQNLTMRILFLILIVRFCLPLSSVANGFVHQHYFVDQISAANNELAVGSVELDKLKDFSLPEIDGVIGTIENSASFLNRKSIALKNALVDTVSNMGATIENLLTLTFLYVGFFLIQIVILPLLSFWLLVKTVNALFAVNAPVILNSSRPSGKASQQSVNAK
ncbi:hypothetical protein DSCA_13570 [Desulfosarcina alkanivorans]|uniref:Uncharacterized protein n=1 Tax=Desulfosarcina alkanivorans TaxID=571177 RepID=A0A5K7YS06_9BACT|nr:hypothetical protein [Desulfosarcina alkanivorans]BBO67427.1 hypothetical protein DSCA_13570 [Desulfosarcina alkanivorans]